MKKLAVVLAVVWCTVVLAERDITADIHLHTGSLSNLFGKGRGDGFSDGLRSPQSVFNLSNCRVVVFTDHLDGICERGTDLYLSTIRALSTDKKLAVPGVEVTCGYDYSAYDVVVIGLNNESLAELASLYRRGAFHDPENGLPALKLVASRYSLLLIAAHPDNTTIPFDLKGNAQYADGFELYDSKHVGYTVLRFGENCAAIYKTRDRVTITAGSDYHYFLSGALPTRSPLEAPVTHIILDDGAEVTEANVLDSLRRGRTYAASLIGAAITSANQLPGGVWRPDSDPEGGKLVISCSGLSESSLLYPCFAVIVSNGQTTVTQGFRPYFSDGKATLVLNFAQLQMPDAKAINVNFGGRIVTSTISVVRSSVASSQQPAGNNKIGKGGTSTPPATREVPDVAGVWIGKGASVSGAGTFKVTVTIGQQGTALELNVLEEGITPWNWMVDISYTGTITPDGVIKLAARTSDQSSGVDAGYASGFCLRFAGDGTLKQTSTARRPTDLEWTASRLR